MVASIWRSFTFVIVITIYVIICPYTKVEESFNIQAIHDVIYHRWHVEKYDHKDFPGVVPRTFIGALLVGLVTLPCSVVMSLSKCRKDILQVIARIFLGCFAAFSFTIYRRAVAKALSHSTANLLILLTITQFHFMFYASRALPNTFALILILPALAYWLENKIQRFIWFSAFTAIIFRAEICLLVGPLLLICLLKGRIGLISAMKHSILAGMSALALTVLVDSIFWGKILWPEGFVLYYNTILNKSSNWGTSPFLWYFYSAIPRCLLFTLPLVPIGFLKEDKNFTGLLISSLLFVFLYSLLPHKELRFIIYVIPVLNTSAAVGALQVLHWTRKHGILQKLAYLGLGMLLFGNFLATGFFSYVAYHNYPGGVAFSKLHQIVGQSENVSVHIDNYAAQTGVTRFGELNMDWSYSKEENLDHLSPELQKFTHLIREAPCSSFSKTHDVISLIDGYSKINLNFNSMRDIFQVEFVTKLCILQRRAT